MTNNETFTKELDASKGIMFVSPLTVPVSKRKKFILNLNNFRNCHFQVLNKAKKTYKELIREEFKFVAPFDKVHIHYVLYPKTKRLTDIANVISIHAKFFCDAMVEYGLIEDDNYKFVVSSSESFGHIDKDNPRVEIIVSEIKNET